MRVGKLILTVCLLGGILFPPKSFSHPDPSHTLAEINEHLAATPDDQATLRSKVDVLLEMDQTAQARDVVAHLLKLNPQSPENLLQSALVMRAEDNLPAALTQVEALTRSNPEFASGWDYLARFAHESERHDEAIQAQLRFLKDHPSLDPSDYMICAAWLQDRGQPGDDLTALSVLDQGIAKIGVLIALQQAAIKIDLSRQNWDSALRRIDALSARFRPSVDFATQRGEILEQAQRYAEAASAFDSAIAILQASPFENRDQAIFETRMTLLKQRKEANRALAAAPAAPQP